MSTSCADTPEKDNKVYVSVKDAVKALNSMLKADPGCIWELFEKRAYANRKLTEHPTAQCGTNKSG